MTTFTKDGNANKLVPHDGVSEVFVCRDCGQQIDPVGTHYDGYTEADCDNAKCPLCGGIDTGWLFSAV